MLIMMRHGESVWNQMNVFTGWVDVPLSPKGIEEALRGGEKIANIAFDEIYVSTLIRAQMTAFLAMSCSKLKKVPIFLHPGEGKMEEWGKIYSEETKKNCIPVYAHSDLNERMYGELQGQNKDETRQKFGVDQVKIWRRSFDTAPPGGESLEMTAKRTLPYFQNKIVPKLAEGKNILISAHGNSMRAIVMGLENLSKEEVLSLEIPTGEPIGYQYDDGKWTRLDL